MCYITAKEAGICVSGSPGVENHVVGLPSHFFLFSKEFVCLICVAFFVVLCMMVISL